MKKTSVTLVDVAKKAGVSVMTASRSLSPDGYAAEKTRAKVIKAAEELGYAPNAAARIMKGGRTNVIGVVVNDLSSEILIAFVTAISAEVRKYNMDLFIYNSAVDLENANGLRISQMLHGLWDGLIFVLPRLSEDYLRALEKNGNPIVLLNYCQPTTLPVVCADNQGGARDAVAHLIQLGHRRIAFIRGSGFTGQSAQREQGYRTALGQAGLSPDPKWMVQGDFSEASGLIAGRSLLELPEPPTAIFAANDTMAIGCANAVRERGLKVPDDISIIGFDDIPAAAISQPGLTTLRHPVAAMAQAAVQELIRRIQDQPGRRQRIEFPSEFIVRESTGPAPDAVASKRGRPRRQAA